MSVAVWRRGPPPVSAGVAVLAAVVAGAAAQGGEGWWALLPPTGVVLVAVGLWQGRRRLLSGGCGTLVVAAFVAGLAGTGTPQLVVAVGAALVTWDLGEHALTLDDQLGPGADTLRLESLHVGTVAAVVTAGVGVVFVLFGLADAGQPEVAVVLLVVGALALLSTLRTA